MVNGKSVNITFKKKPPPGGFFIFKFDYYVKAVMVYGIMRNVIDITYSIVMKGYTVFIETEQ